MKLKTEKEYLIIILVVLAIAFAYFYFKKKTKKTESGYKTYGGVVDPFGNGEGESGYASKKMPPTQMQLQKAGVVNSRTAYKYLQNYYGGEQGITIAFGGCGGQQTDYGYVLCKKVFCIFGVCVCTCPSDAQGMLANLPI
jgi:hypothetical protein